jgi:hypothetical protein
MSDADIISTVKQLRRIVTTLDAMGFPTKTLAEDSELGTLVPKGLPAKIVNVAADIHHMLVGIEKSQKYKNAIKTLCEIKERP